MRVTSMASLAVLSLVAVVAGACGGDSFAPGATAGNGGNAGSTGTAGAGAGGTTAGGTSGGGATAAGTGGAAGTSSGGSAGTTSMGGAAGSGAPKSCNTGADCGKADPCVGVPYCSDHTCFLDTSAVVSIEDNDKCTKDACNPLTGLPTHTPIPLGDGNPCTKDDCNPTTGPTHVPDPACTGCKANADCDDGDPCTDDVCTNTKCTNPAKNVGDECGAGDACTGKSVCDDKGKCNPTKPVDVNDKNECTVDTCDPATGKVSHLPRPVDDDNVCTTDGCDPEKGLTHETIKLDDGDACTDDICHPKTGPAHPPLPLGDGNPCTIDTCDKTDGPKHDLMPMCNGKCQTDAACADKNPCTKDVCKDGACIYESNEDEACDDGLFCTANDRCTASTCKGTPVAVDDGKACTVDSCDEANDKIVNIVTVDDGNACTQDSCGADGAKLNSPIAECCTSDDQCEQILPAVMAIICRKASRKCDANACVPNPSTTIDDGVACTKDICDPLTGLVTHTPMGKGNGCCATSDDCPGGAQGDKCFAPGKCDTNAFTCVYGAGELIDDGAACTTDTCKADGSVLHAPKQGIPGCCSIDLDCDQGGVKGELCVPAEKCQQGQCVSQGTGMTRPGPDTICGKYVCDPRVGSWEDCCLAGGGECDICTEPDLGSVCSGIKQ